MTDGRSLPNSINNDNNPHEFEYQVHEIDDHIGMIRRSSFCLLSPGGGAAQFRRRNNHGCIFSRYVFHPDNKLYQYWKVIILLWATYSSFFTPFEFGFFRGLPRNLFWLDFTGQIAFLLDIIFHFFVAYKDDQTYRVIYNPTSIALRYLRSSFVLDFLGCLPWDVIYKASGDKEEVRYLLWIRLTRAQKITDFFHQLEKDIRINYLFTRIVKLIFVEFYCTHIAACIFYYLATTLPASKEDYTWIGSLKLGEYSYSHFRDIDLSRRYLTSLYFAIATMSTVGYGDIHAVNIREMIFIMFFVSFDMVLGAYLIGNMTALIVKGSRTEIFRDKMKELMTYMNKNRLGRDIRDQIKGHVRLQYESNFTEAAVLQHIPVSIRAKVAQELYSSYIENVPLFKGCSTEFIRQIVIRLQEEFFLPGEVIMEKGDAVDQLYFICHGTLKEGFGIGEDGSEETVLLLEPYQTFGEIAILCNIPQPYTVRVCELCRLLRIDKQMFANILQIYFVDGRTILNNLVESNESSSRIKHLETDITSHIGKQEAELALRLNSATFHGDLNHIKNLIQSGADPSKTDYDGRTPLHLAASNGYEDIVTYLIQEGVDVNKADRSGNTALFEAVKNGYDNLAALLYENGAKLKLKNAGNLLCSAVAQGDSEFIRRLLSFDIDPNSMDYDHRTPLHIAAADGLYLIVKMLLENGASVFSMDRRGNTPLYEAWKSGSRPLIRLMEEAKSEELSKFPDHVQEVQDKRHRCTVFPFHPWNSNKNKKEGVMLWVPQTIDELIQLSQEQLHCSGTILLSEDGGKILEADMISDNQKLYLVSDMSSYDRVE